MRLKTAKDIAGIYRSGQITGQFLLDVAELIAPGVKTAELDRFAKEYITKHGGTAAFFGYNGFPGHICASINDQVVHGIPGSQVLLEGDLLSIDVGVVLDGYVSDAASSYIVGDKEVPKNIQRLLDGTRLSLAAGIKAFKDHTPLRNVSRAIEQVLKGHKLGIVRELTGHGVGFQLHEDPTVYNFDPGTRKPLLTNGMVLAIEPMATLGSEIVLLSSDNWTYCTADASLAAHYEHTIACWDGRPFILTDPTAEDSKQAFG